MHTFSIDFTVPQGWHEFGDKQLRFVYQLIADGNNAARLQTEDAALLDQLAAVLYPGEKDTIILKPFERIAIFYWMASLKDFFSHRFRDFFQSVIIDFFVQKVRL